MFKNQRKGIELTMNLVIIAAISLLVLIILAFMLMKGFGGWNSGTTCSSQGGQCMIKCEGSYPVSSLYTCGKNNLAGSHCCVNIGGLGEEIIPTSAKTETPAAVTK